MSTIQPPPPHTHTFRDLELPTVSGRSTSRGASIFNTATSLSGSYPCIRRTGQLPNTYGVQDALREANTTTQGNVCIEERSSPKGWRLEKACVNAGDSSYLDFGLEGCLLAVYRSKPDLSRLCLPVAKRPT